MKPEEKRLRYFLNYVYDESDVFVNVKEVLYFKNTFLNYWQTLDQIENSNYSQLISELYLSGEDVNLANTAKNFGLHIRTLRRYRRKFIMKMKELLKDF